MVSDGSCIGEPRPAKRDTSNDICWYRSLSGERDFKRRSSGGRSTWRFKYTTLSTASQMRFSFEECLLKRVREVNRRYESVTASRYLEQQATIQPSAQRVMICRHWRNKQPGQHNTSAVNTTILTQLPQPLRRDIGTCTQRVCIAATAVTPRHETRHPTALDPVALGRSSRSCSSASVRTPSVRPLSDGRRGDSNCCSVACESV